MWVDLAGLDWEPPYGSAKIGAKSRGHHEDKRWPNETISSEPCLQTHEKREDPAQKAGVDREAGVFWRKEQHDRTVRSLTPRSEKSSSIMYDTGVVMNDNKARIAVTIDPDLLLWIDQEVKAKRFGSRSHAVEYSVTRLKETENKPA